MIQKRKPPSECLSEYRIFYVIFCDSAKHRYSFFCKKGFGHCYVIEKLEHIYIMFDPTRCGLKVTIPPCDTSHPLAENMMILDEGLRIVELHTNGDDEKLIYSIKLLSCVSALQYILGLKFKGFCFTPYQLYKALFKQNDNIVLAKEL